MTGHMAQSLSRALAERGPGSEPWVVSMQEVVNLSSDVIPEREQWSVLYQVRGAQPIAALWDTKAVRFVMPRDRVEAMRADEDAEEFSEPAFGADRAPTHVLTATFRSVTRGEPEGKVRTDVYLMEFEVLPVAGGEPVWNDRFEFKRAARGRVWD